MKHAELRRRKWLPRGPGNHRALQGPPESRPCPNCTHGGAHDALHPCRVLVGVASCGCLSRTRDTGRTRCDRGHWHQSPLEREVCEALVRLEASGEVAQLTFQRTHRMFLYRTEHQVNGGSLLGTELDAWQAPGLAGWCSCMSETLHGRAPRGFVKVASCRPDFEYLRRESPGTYRLVTADAKGAMKEAQGNAYATFSALHGREVELVRRGWRVLP